MCLCTTDSEVKSCVDISDESRSIASGQTPPVTAPCHLPPGQTPQLKCRMWSKVPLGQMPPPVKRPLSVNDSALDDVK